MQALKRHLVYNIQCHMRATKGRLTLKIESFEQIKNILRNEPRR